MLVDAAEGNPLFVEQMLAMIGDAPDAPDRGAADHPGADLRPARPDRREERAVIEPASVIGQVFAHPVVEELAPPALAPHVGCT